MLRKPVNRTFLDRSCHHACRKAGAAGRSGPFLTLLSFTTSCSASNAKAEYLDVAAVGFGLA